MKHVVRGLLLFVVGVFFTGCHNAKDGESEVGTDELGTAAEQRDKAFAATKEAAQSVQEYAYTKRGEFIDAANRELSGMRAEMDRLGAEIDRSRGAARAEAEAKLTVLKEKWGAAKAQLARAETATAASWDDVQNRYRTARSDLNSSFDDTRQWLSQRIEP
jgi:phage protein D